MAKKGKVRVSRAMVVPMRLAHLCVGGSIAFSDKLLGSIK
jgi:hypothetical protein